MVQRGSIGVPNDSDRHNFRPVHQRSSYLNFRPTRALFVYVCIHIFSDVLLSRKIIILACTTYRTIPNIAHSTCFLQQLAKQIGLTGRRELFDLSGQRRRRHVMHHLKTTNVIKQTSSIVFCFFYFDGNHQKRYSVFNEPE